MLKTYPRAFTVVELLIVVVVIGILAGLGYAGFRGTETRAIDTEVKTDASNIADKIELFFLDNKRFPDELTELGQVKKGTSTTVSYESNSTSFCMTVTSTKPGVKSFTVRDDTNIQEGNCTGWIAHGGTSTPPSGGGTPPPAIPAPSAATVSYTGPTRVRVSTNEWAQRYAITTSGGTCSVGTTEWKMGATSGSSFNNGWAWQTSNTIASDVLENGIYSATDVTIYAKPRCVSGGQVTEGTTVHVYHGSGGGGTGGSV